MATTKNWHKNLKATHCNTLISPLAFNFYQRKYKEKENLGMENFTIFLEFLPVEACNDWWCLDLPGMTEWRRQAGTCDTCNATKRSNWSEIEENQWKLKASNHNFDNLPEFQNHWNICQQRGYVVSEAYNYDNRTNINQISPWNDWKTHINSQSKQHIVSPVKNRVDRCVKWSLIFLKCASSALFFCSSFLTKTSFSFE